MGRTRAPAQPDTGKEREQQKPQEGEQGGLEPGDRRLADQTIPADVQQIIDENASDQFKEEIRQMAKTPEAVDDLIKGVQNRLQAQRQASGGRETPAVKEIESNLVALRAVKSWIETLPATNRRRLPEVGTQTPNDKGTQTPPAPTPAKPANPHDATKDKLKKKNLRPFVPSRRRVLDKARNLVLRRPSQRGLSTLDEVRPYPDNVNSFAPDPVETVSGRFRTIM
jgi:hypothetical protein